MVLPASATWNFRRHLEIFDPVQRCFGDVVCVNGHECCRSGPVRIITYSPQPIDIDSQKSVPRHSGSGRTFVKPTDTTFYPLKSNGSIMINMYVRCGMIIKCSVYMTFPEAYIYNRFIAYDYMLYCTLKSN